MMAFTLIPLALFAGGRSRFTITGGLFQDFAPTALHMEKVLLPLLGQMGAKVDLKVIRPGYTPKGSGELGVSVQSARTPLRPFQKTQKGEIRKILGVSLASNLERESVARRMAERSRELLAQEGCSPEIEIIEDFTAVQKGAALLLWAETDGGCLLGSDMAGKLGRSSEAIAQSVVRGLFADIATGATVDRFAADQLILFAGLAAGQSRYIVPRLTDHIESNLWLIEKILGARSEFRENRICVDGIGFFGK
jgi:RNA 3'-terminal phosphate cyclase (ATP)